jgi:hypothetical protein
MFYGKFADKGENPVNNSNIYNHVEGTNRFSPDLQHVVPTFTIPDDRKFVENPVSVIVLSMPIIIVFSSEKQNIQVIKISFGIILVIILRIKQI